MEEKIKVNLTGVTLDSDYANQNCGYPIVANNLYSSLQECGFQMSSFDILSDINISYAVPKSHIMFAAAYNILYTAHETTMLSDEWSRLLDRGDEIWATSEWTANNFRKTVSNKVHAVPHGVSGKFVPQKRKAQDKFIFLHTGEPYQRKGGQVAVEAFLEEFSDNDDVILVIKSYEFGHTIRVDDGTGKMVEPQIAYNNIKTIKSDLPFNEYINLLYASNCLVYPSWGEGFGLMPLEAMASGMPVISTWEWSDYKDEIKYKIDSDIVSAEDYAIPHLKKTYKGEMCLPKIDSIRYNMRQAYENCDSDIAESFQKARLIHKNWNWQDIIEKYAAPRLREIYGELHV